MSRCKYCKTEILWVAKPNGHGWFPPFDMPEAMQRMRYTLIWNATGDWMAKPEDESQDISLSSHHCEEREIFLERMLDEGPPPRYEMNPIENLDTVPIRQAPVERIVYEEHSHERTIAVARKLKIVCPKCHVMPFEWCIYISGGNIGQETIRLHKERQ